MVDLFCILDVFPQHGTYKNRKHVFEIDFVWQTMTVVKLHQGEILYQHVDTSFQLDFTDCMRYCDLLPLADVDVGALDETKSQYRSDLKGWMSRLWYL